jgi:DNA-binding LytR/AlgR family response regulator
MLEITKEIQCANPPLNITTDYFILSKNSKETERIKRDKILYIQSLSDYVQLFVEEDDHEIVRCVIKGTMDAIEKSLHGSNFKRIYRLFIINEDRVFCKNKLNNTVTLLLPLGKEKIFPVGRKYKEFIWPSKRYKKN